MQSQIFIRRRASIALAALAWTILIPARAAVTLPGGDSLLNGGFDDINYGATGLAYVTPLLYTGDLGVTESPTSTATTTGLTYDYTVNGLGSSLATIEYVIGNEGPATFTDLRFMVDLQPDGSSSFNDEGRIVPDPWPPAEPGDPDQFQIAEFTENLAADIVNNNGLNGLDSCGGSCDLEFALQWNLAQILPGEVWSITVGLSDDGQSLSGHYLQAASVDTADTVLTFSGQAAVVPLPPALVLFGSALGGLWGLARRRRT